MGFKPCWALDKNKQFALQRGWSRLLTLSTKIKSQFTLRLLTIMFCLLLIKTRTFSPIYHDVHFIDIHVWSGVNCSHLWVNHVIRPHPIGVVQSVHAHWLRSKVSRSLRSYLGGLSRKRVRPFPIMFCLLLKFQMQFFITILCTS